MLRIFSSLIVLIALFLFIGGGSSAQGDEVYKDKIIRIMPYTSPGSTHDILARMAAPYLEKYIKGHPRIIVQNMPGAGGVIVANYLYNLAKPDGFTVGVFSRGTPILGVAKIQGVQYDPTKFRWVLSPSRDVTVCVAFADAGFDSIKDVIGTDKRLFFSATGRAAGSFQVPSTLNATLGTTIKVITGYRGSGGHQLAMERREVDGRCLSYYGTKVQAFLRDGLKSGLLRILVQLPERHPDLPDVVLANDLISKSEDIALIKLVASPLNPWVTPPGTPNDRLAILREGFFKAFQDPEFRKSADRAGFELNPIPGNEAEAIMQKMLDMPLESRQKLNKILGQ